MLFIISMQRLTLKIHGRVQGVYFREDTEKLARELGLVGYVKNLSDGTVEVVVEGEEGALKKLLEWCKIGPQRAVVENVDVKWREVEKSNFDGFKIEF